MLLPVDFPYPVFASIIFCNGIGSGLFASPNTSSIMSSVPAEHRGAASGMRSVFMNSGMSLSIGFFFSLMIAGLSGTLPKTLGSGLRAQGVPAAAASHIAHLPPVSTLFSALLGYNPVKGLLAPTGVLAKLPAHNVAVLTGTQFFPHLIAAPFKHGLVVVYSAAIAMSVAGALISLLRGKQFYYEDRPAEAPLAAKPGDQVATPLAVASFPADAAASANGNGSGTGSSPAGRRPGTGGDLGARPAPSSAAD
jgi:hypothetical protein